MPAQKRTAPTARYYIQLPASHKDEFGSHAQSDFPNIQDTKGGISAAKRAYKQYPSVQKFCADAGYRGTFVSDLKEQLELNVDISEKIKPHQMSG